MACGSCGGGVPSHHYTVTFRDGTQQTFTTLAEARLQARADASQGARSATVRAVPIKKV